VGLLSLLSVQSCESLSKSLGDAPSFTQPCWLFAAQAHSSQAMALIDTNRKAKIDASQVKINTITRHASSHHKQAGKPRDPEGSAGPDRSDDASIIVYHSCVA
jgi:hypothetical protein